MIELTIPGEAIGKQRARVVRMRAGFPVAYTPKKTVNYETLIRELFAVKYPGFEPLAGPVWMRVHAFLGVPKSESARRQREMEDGLIRPTKKPDFDNITKSFSDALNGLAYRDDSQVVNCEVKKFYSRKPHVLIQIGSL